MRVRLARLRSFKLRRPRVARVRGCWLPWRAALLGLCAVAAWPGAAAAQAALEPDESPISRWVRQQEAVPVWQGEVAVGYLETNGTTDSRSGHMSARVQYERGRWRHTGRTEAIVEQEEGVTTTARYQVLQKSAYTFTRREYVFEQVRAERNRPEDLDYRLAGIAGFGRRMVAGEQLTLDLEAGVGRRQTRTVARDEQRREPIAEMIGELAWQITAGSRLNESLSVQSGADSTLSRSVTALTIQTTERLALSTSYEWVHHTAPVGEGSATETITALTVVYSF